ncbi:MAG: hypothetical protein M1827_007034 [Pycnora praestabilis]|nr:MAG: hypothetical protein M1827_007034 [Pycnora praestabilis]
MSPQSEGRPSTDGHFTGDASFSNRGGQQHEFDPYNLNHYPRTNGYGTPERNTSRKVSTNTGMGDDRSAGDEPPPSPSQSGRARDNTTTLPIRTNGRDNTTSLPIRSSADANGRSANGPTRVCMKCDEPLTGQFVRALGGTFHLDCFKCRDCGQIVASKFFPVDDEDSDAQYPLCETDYFRRLDLLCFECGGALRVFGAQDSYYEHEGRVYCHYHYSTQFAQRCNGCQTAILKQFVEIFRNGQNQHWHPECYMIHKFWNVRLAPSGAEESDRPVLDINATDEERTMVREQEERMEDKVYKIWSVLSTFEESSAACISDMLLHVSNGAYVDGVLVAKKFIWHVDILFSSADRLDSLMTSQGMKGLSYSREAKLLCKKIVAFFSLLSKTQETGVRKLGVTQELLSLVTGLAHYLKLLIRISLQGTLKLERERSSTEGLCQFLDELGNLESIKEAEKSLDSTAGVSGLADQSSDICSTCNGPIEDECARLGERRWHLNCISCSNCLRDLGRNLEDTTWSDHEHLILCQACANHAADAEGGFEHITRLQQYVFLLRVALARLLSILRAGGTLPHTSDDPNLKHYDSNEGHRVSPSGQFDPPLLRSNTQRSKSYAGMTEQTPSSYEDTLVDIRRLRSTRMDKHLSTTIKKARTSRIIDGPEGRSVRPGSAGADGSDARNHGFQIVEDRDMNGEAISDLTFGNHDALTLDDIPRIVAAEQAKEQRPNAYKHARNQLFSSGGQQPKLLNGHNRDVSGGHDPERIGAGDTSTGRPKKYFSELSALEYFIVRHVAVLSMEPLVEGHFNLEELLGLIESRKPTFWNKFGKAFKNDGRKKKGVFGVALDGLVEKDGVDSTYGIGPGALKVPPLLDDAVSAMRQMDMSVEGVFRKNGNIRRLKELADLIDQKGGDDVDLNKENPVQVAALMKKFLRELPDPLLTYKLHRLFITAQKIGDDEKRRRVLHLTCCLLPKSHRDSMEILFSFLNWASSFSHVDDESGSKMDTHNIATVVAPNILKSNSKNPGMDDSFLAIEAVNTLIECNDQMCEVPEDLQSILSDSTLYNGGADVTTKEILKRYGDIARNPGPRRIVRTTDSPPPRSKDGRGGPPVATRVDTDPYQATAWQKESSVRHVQGPGAQNLTYAPSSSNQFTPPQLQYEFSNPNSPYHQRAGSSDTQGSAGPNDRYRHSGLGRQHGQPGQLSVSGAG